MKWPWEKSIPIFDRPTNKTDRVGFSIPVGFILFWPKGNGVIPVGWAPSEQARNLTPAPDEGTWIRKE